MQESAASRLVVLSYGFLSLVAQVVLLRELLVLAQGRELHLSLALWAWLGWTGLGSLAGGWLAVRWPPRLSQLGYLLWGLALLLPLTILAARGWPLLTAADPGSPLSLGQLLSAFLLLTAPFCFLSGLVFPAACAALKAPSTDDRGLIGRVYGWEAVGMCLGGITATLLVVAGVANLPLAAGAGLLTLGTILACGPKPRRRGALLLLALTGLLLLGAWVWDRPSRQWQVPGRELVAVLETPYNLWQVTRVPGLINFHANGLWCGSWPDPQTAEEQAHFALLQHPRPQKVLLLGGGIFGLAAEILRHPPVMELVYVEPDPGLLQVAPQVLPPEAALFLADPRLIIIRQDGRRFLQEDGRLYDIILVALPAPQTVQWNRFYTHEFLQLARRRLQPDGVFSFSLPGSETSLSPYRRRYLQLLAATANQVFPEMVVLPGTSWRFAAAGQPGLLTVEPQVLAARLRERHLALDFVREDYWQVQFSPMRQAFGRRLLADPPPVLNTDLSPSGFYYGLLLTSLEERSPLAGMLLTLKNWGGAALWGGLLGVTALLWGWRAWGWGYPAGLTPSLAALVLGFSAMGAEVVLILVFQLGLGSLYGELGLLLLAFMGGLAGGAMAGSRGAGNPGPSRLWCLAVQGSLAGWLGLLGWGLPTLVGSPWLRAAVWGHLLVAGLLAVTGGLCGMLFAVLGAQQQELHLSLTGRAGWLYALDLAGATAGSLGGGFLLLPCYGLASVLFLGAGLNLLVAGLWALPTRP